VILRFSRHRTMPAAEKFHWQRLARCWRWASEVKKASRAFSIDRVRAGASSSVGTALAGWTFARTLQAPELTAAAWLKLTRATALLRLLIDRATRLLLQRA
jgi:hypothetical protein